MIQAPKNLNEFSSLIKIVEALRSEQGCPWDKEQTHRSLATFAIEEAFELAEAIEANDRSEMISELGDLLLQVALHSQIAKENSLSFTVEDVIRSINEKMVRRHPHVFANVEAKDADQVLQNWAEIKAEERKNKAGPSKTESFEIPPNLPSLMRAQKIGVKTKSQQFDWKNASEVMSKLEEELSELKQAIIDYEKNSDAANDPKLQIEIEHEMGDLLFSAAQLARHLKLDAEQSLRVANQRFEKRFFKMMDLAQKSLKTDEKPTQLQLEGFWSEVKRLEKQAKAKSHQK